MEVKIFFSFQNRFTFRTCTSPHTQGTGRGQRYQDLEVETELSVDLLLDSTELFQQRFALGGGANDEHFHLAELVDAVQAPAGRPCTSPKVGHP